MGQAFKLSITNPVVIESTGASGSVDWSKFDKATAILINQYLYVDSSIFNQKAALDKFDINLLKGSIAEVEYPNICCDTSNLAIFIAPIVESNYQIIELELKAKVPGTYFLFLEDATDGRQVQIGDYNDDGCQNSINFNYNNTSKNDFSFLDGTIQTSSLADEYLERYSLVAFEVK